MANYDVSQADVDTAVAFMKDFLQTRVPEGDFAEGGPLHDFLIKGASYLTAYLLKQVKVVRDRQSLLTLGDLPEEESVADAADAILANFFRTRDQGTFARGSAQIHLAQRVDVVVPRGTRFFKTQSNVFFLDGLQDLFIPATSLRPTLDSSGRVVDWVATIGLVAARVGADYNLDAGRFVAFDRFSPFATYVESTVKYNGGVGALDTATFIERSRTAIALRALINARSNEALAFEQFPAIERVLTVGMGDAEMVRDLVTEPGLGLTLHIGGHADIYVRTPVQEVVESKIVGDVFLRPDDRVLVFREVGVDFVGALGVKVGDVLLISAGLPEAPFEYKITAVRTTELEVSDRTPFSVATTEDDTPPTFSYSIGNNYPLFNNKLNTPSSATAGTARSFEAANSILLEGRPVYAIKKVEVLDAPGALDPYKDPATGTLLFTERVNDAITAVPSPGAALQYRIRVLRPNEAQSGVALTVLEVGWPGVSLDNLTVEVTYETSSDFSTFDEYVRDPQNRVTAANVLARAAHPVYLSFTVPYALAASTNPFAQTATTFDEVAAGTAMVEFVNAYTGGNPLDQSLLATQARALSADLAAIYPFEIEYSLLGPDGRVYEYVTTDRVTVFPDGVSGAQLKNPTDFGLPLTNYYEALRKQLVALGVSDRVLRPRALSGAVTFERRA